MVKPEQTTRYLERLCWTLAAVCLLPYALASGARAYYAAFADPLESSAVDPLPATAPATPSAQLSRPLSQQPPSRPETVTGAEHPLWARQRVREFLRFKSGAVPAVSAVLRLPKHQRNIPVFSSDSEVSMTLGAGHLEDTSPLDGSGNIAVSAHRDGTFRVLKDVQIGDPLILSVGGEDRLFVVKRQSVVEPEQVEVLEPTAVTTPTLVTCYPFYYVGNAPNRYVVQAEIAKGAEIQEAFSGSRTAPATRSSYGSLDRMRRNDI